MQTGPNMSPGYYGFHAPNATAFNTSKLNYNCHNNLDPIHAYFWHFHSKTKGSPKRKTFNSQIKSLGSNSVSTYENILTKIYQIFLCKYKFVSVYTVQYNMGL